MSIFTKQSKRMDITNHHILPFNISLSFKLLLEQYQERLANEKNELVKQHLNVLIEKFKKCISAKSRRSRGLNSQPRSYRVAAHALRELSFSTRKGV